MIYRQGADEHDPMLVISCAASLAEINFNDSVIEALSASAPVPEYRMSLPQLRARFPQDEPLVFCALGMNGEPKSISNAWRLFSENRKDFVRIKHDLVLGKKSVCFTDFVEDEVLKDEKFWNWATLLSHRNDDGTIQKATQVDICTGAIFNGAYVYFGQDEMLRATCGPKEDKWGNVRYLGGHASEDISIPEDQEIVKVVVSRDSWYLRGLRIYLGNGVSRGLLSGGADEPETVVLGNVNNYAIWRM